MSEHEWNAIRLTFRRAIIAYRRLLVVNCIGTALVVVVCIALFVTEQWVAFIFGAIAASLTLAGCPSMVLQLQDLQDRLEWMEDDW